MSFVTSDPLSGYRPGEIVLAENLMPSMFGTIITFPFRMTPSLVRIQVVGEFLKLSAAGDTISILVASHDRSSAPGGVLAEFEVEFDHTITILEPIA